jgi:radical SAM superfamily enzyme YgiQ (UPF0313 family)
VHRYVVCERGRAGTRIIWDLKQQRVLARRRCGGRCDFCDARDFSEIVRRFIRLNYSFRERKKRLLADGRTDVRAKFLAGKDPKNLSLPMTHHETRG